MAGGWAVDKPAVGAGRMAGWAMEQVQIRRQDMLLQAAECWMDLRWHYDYDVEHGFGLVVAEVGEERSGGLALGWERGCCWHRLEAGSASASVLSPQWWLLYDRVL